jgi:hypothetical protein
MTKELKQNTETLVDENGIEILVGYNYEQSPSQKEEGHGIHEVGNQIYTELSSVEVVIAGVGIDVLPRMTEKQKEEIISKLEYANR